VGGFDRAVRANNATGNFHIIRDSTGRRYTRGSIKPGDMPIVGIKPGDIPIAGIKRFRQEIYPVCIKPRRYTHSWYKTGRYTYSDGGGFCSGLRSLPATLVQFQDAEQLAALPSRQRAPRGGSGRAEDLTVQCAKPADF
jgi:hypothetical protein